MNYKRVRSYYLVVLFYSILVGCGQANAYPPKYSTYIQNFKDFTGQSCDYVSLVESDADPRQSSTGTVIADCTHQTHLITVYTKLYDTLPDLIQEYVIYHEMAHCCFNVLHDNSKRADGCPVSVMSAPIPSQTCISKHGEEYKQILKEIGRSVFE